MSPQNTPIFSGEMLSRKLNIYTTKFIVHGYLWFHTIALPTGIGWVHQVLPVIHNYPLILGMLGHTVEETYANILGEPSYIKARSLIRDEMLYVYPAVAKKSLTRKIQFAGIGDGYASIKGKTRLSYPERGFNTILLPGSELLSFIITEKSSNELPRFIRIGSKRFGILKVVYTKVEYRIVEDRVITHPANTHDTDKLTGGIQLLKHRGGDIVIMSRTPIAIEAKLKEKGKKQRVFLAFPTRALGDLFD